MRFPVRCPCGPLGRLVSAAAMAVLPVAVGCVGPARIDRLTVRPTEVCPNDPVEASWSADGASVQLRQDPPMSLTAPRLSSDGIQGLSGNQDFDVVVEARDGAQPAVRRKYVHVISEAWTFTLSGPPQCGNGEIRVVVDFHMADPQIDLRMQVTSVGARADRPMTIVHGSVAPVTLPIGSTTAFEGTPLAGVWTLIAPLKPGESCEGGGAVPLTPAVIVSGTCSGVPPASAPAVAAPADAAPRCGNLGQGCCAGAACEGTYHCDARTLRCLDPQRPAYLTNGTRCNGQPTTELSRSHYIGVHDSFGCGEVAAELADSREEANACALKKDGDAVVGGSIRRYDFCKAGRVRVYVPAFSEEDATRCVRHLWPGVPLEPGLCPN